MERKWLLWLISVVSLFLATLGSTHAATNYTIDDFEAIADWSVVTGNITLNLDTTNFKEGSAALRAEWNDDGPDFIISKNLIYPINITREEFYMWIYSQTTTFPTIIIFQFYESAARCGISGELSLTPNAWNFFNGSGAFPETLGNCDVVDEVRIASQGTGPPPEQVNLTFDIFEITLPDSCTIPETGDWVIENSDVCTLNVTATVPALNISSGSLEIQGSGTLTVSGGFAYIYPGSNLTLLSGGQLNG